MTEKANLFREVKVVTRSLLLSAPNGLSLRSFVNDYYKQNGMDFPYRELGYKSPLDLIMNLRDAVHMQWLPHLDDYLLKAIPDESTKHIENLVKRQRKSKSSAYHHPPRFQKQNKDLFRNSIGNTGPARRSGGQSLLKRVTQQHLSRAVPVKIRSQIRQLVSSFEDGLLLSNFEIAFKKQFGTNFPFVNLGFYSLEDCLRKIPDIVLLQGSGSLLKAYPARRKYNEEHRFANSSVVVPERGFEMTERLKKKSTVDEIHKIAVNCLDELDEFDSQESSTEYNSNQDNNISRNCIDTFGSMFSLKTKCDRHDSFSEAESKSYLSENQNNVESDFNSRFHHNTNENSASLRNNYFTPNCGPETQLERDDDTAPISATDNLSSDSGISEKMKKDFRRVLELCPKGIWATQFLDKYTALTRQTLNISELGYFSLIEMVSALPDIFTIRRPDNRKDDWLLLNTDDAKHTGKVSGEASVSQKLSLCKEPEINETLKHNIVNILKHCCGNIPLEKFEKIYMDRFNVDLPWAESGFDNIEAFMLTLSEEIGLVLKNINGEFYITCHSESPKFQMSSDILMGGQPTSSAVVPSDAAMSDYSFQKQALPEDLSQYVAAFVSAVEHPGQIWIQIRGETTTIALEVLMENLEKVYYAKHADDYNMPVSFVEVGQVCAVVWPGDGNWHRAVVTGIPSKEFAEVFYVDYGSRGDVKKSNLKFLKKEFLCLPAQALKARLAHVLPAVGKRWSEKSKQVLLSLCADRPLAALITNTEYEERLSVCLCDVSEDNDFHINDFLVREGYAKACKDPYCIDDYNESMGNYMLSSPVNQMQQRNMNEVALTSANYCALTEMINFAAANLLSQLSNSGINSLPHLLSSLDLSAHRSPHTDDITSPSDSASQHERNWTEEHREIFEEGDEFYEQLCQSAEELKVSVKRRSLNGGCQVIHIINSNKKPFVSSGDISLLFGKSVCLEKLLLMKKILIPSVTLENTNNEEIFDELKRYDVKGIKKEDGTAKIILYPLSSVIEILDGLSHPSNTLKEEIAKIIIEANDHDDFWQEGNSDDETCLNSQNMNLGSMSIEELSALYKDQFDRRNAIIQKMTSFVGPKDNYVEELHCIENNLSKIDVKMKEMTNSGKNEIEKEHTVLQETSTVSNISYFEPTSVQHSQKNSLSKTCPMSNSEKLHHTSNAVSKRSSSFTQDISTTLSQEVPSKHSELSRDKASTDWYHLQKSPSLKDNEFNNVVNAAVSSISLSKDINTQVKPGVIQGQIVPCCYSEQKAVRNALGTQGKTFPVMPSKPPIRFSSQIFAPTNCPSMFPVRPTSIPPLYSWSGSQSTSS